MGTCHTERKKKKMRTCHLLGIFLEGRHSRRGMPLRRHTSQTATTMSTRRKNIPAEYTTPPAQPDRLPKATAARESSQGYSVPELLTRCTKDYESTTVTTGRDRRKSDHVSVFTTCLTSTTVDASRRRPAQPEGLPKSTAAREPSQCTSVAELPARCIRVDKSTRATPGRDGRNQLSVLTTCSTSKTVDASRRPLTVMFAPLSSRQQITALNSFKVRQALEVICPRGILAVRYDHQQDVIAVDVRNAYTTRTLLCCVVLCGMSVDVHELIGSGNADSELCNYRNV